MRKDLESAGVKPVAVLHINVKGNIQPRKPVKISLPFTDGSVKKHEVMILQSDKSDSFKDVSKDSSVALSKDHIGLQAEHFTT